MCHFLQVLYCNRVSISNHFRDNGHFLYLGYDLDLSMSRDVIGHVTNRSAICHFLLVSHCNRTSISNRFRDIRPPKPVRTCTHTQTHTNTPQVILYSVPCNVLHWTDNKNTKCVGLRRQTYRLSCSSVGLW